MARTIERLTALSVSKLSKPGLYSDGARSFCEVVSLFRGLCKKFSGRSSAKTRSFFGAAAVRF